MRPVSDQGAGASIIDADQESITRAIEDGVLAALEEHHRLGQAVVVWRDGAVLELKGDALAADIERARREVATRRAGQAL